MAKNNRRIPLGTFLIRTAAVLFCLVMITTYLTAGLYARYTASGKGMDSARVAKFDVRALGEIVFPAMPSPGEGEPMKWILDSNGDGTYKITVTNNSEVAVRYGILVELENSAPYMTIKLDETALYAADGTEGKLWKYPQAGTLVPGGASAEHTLTFDMDWVKFTKDVSGESRTVDLPFKVKVHAEQVD